MQGRAIFHDDGKTYKTHRRIVQSWMETWKHGQVQSGNKKYLAALQDSVTSQCNEFIPADRYKEDKLEKINRVSG